MWGFSFKYGGIVRALIPLLLLVGLLQSQDLLAQAPSDKGWIEATYSYGCQGMTITITHTRTGAGALFYTFLGNPNDPVKSDFGSPDYSGAFTEGQNAQFEYKEAGTYYIVVVDGAASGSDEERSDILEITVLPQEPPAVIGRGCASNSLQLTFQKDQDAYDSYLIDYGDGNTLTTDGTSPVNYSYSASGNYTVIIQGRFNNGYYQSCITRQINFTAFNQIPVPVINTIQVESKTSINLNYQPLEAVINYTLQIDRGSGFEDYLNLNPADNPESITLTDPSFNTNSEFYGFRIVAEDDCQSASVKSEVGHSIAFDIVDESVSSTFDVTFSWSTSNQNFNSIDLLNDGSSFQSFNAAQNTGELMSFANCTGPGEFSMTSTINGITSTSLSLTPYQTAPTLTAPSAPVAELNGAVIDIDFPATQFPLGEYVLYRKDITSAFTEVFSSTANSHTDTTIPPGTAQVCYKLAYRDQCGNMSELSDEICIVLSTTLGIPNAFSPNGDGINDLFKINDGIYANFNLKIFNRWGSMVFNSTDPSQGWDGQFEGQPANGGTYLYQISFQNADNLLITKTGSFVLIR